MTLAPRGLFGRTAILIASTLLLFSVIAWQAIVWTVVMPASTAAVEVLKLRAEAAVSARQQGQSPPPDTRFEAALPAELPAHLRISAYATYVESLRTDLQGALHAREVRLGRFAAPAEFWVSLPQVPDAWLVLSWRVARPRAPLVGLSVLAAAALIVLGGAAISARRLTSPLAALADAAAHLADGRRVPVAVDRGPSEVRALAVAFESMSRRLAELDEQRELMLGGISHDLRTPLARIRVAVELMEQQNPALIAEMTASVGEMDRMIGQFLHFVRAGYREAPAAGQPDTIVRETLAIYASDERLEFELDAPGARTFALDCVRHVLLNLVQNALDYGAAPVIVRTRVTLEQLCISVTDAGPGLDPAQWREALRPFHRLRAPTHEGHAGLGLALVERLVSTCGGTLSSARGAHEFTVTARLPITQIAGTF